MASILEILLRAKGGDSTKGELKKVNKEASESTKIFAALGSMLSVGILAKGIKDSIAAYKVQELAVTKLNSALKAQGVFTEALSKKLQEEASALQQVTIFGDEAILASQAFAMSMGLSADTVSKVTPVVLDFASAMGLDLQTAFRVVGLAGAGDTGMLKRYGVIVDEAALKSDGFNAVLGVMQKNFGGTAKAVAKSGVGPMEQFKNTMGDLMEVIGETLVPGINTLLGLLVKMGKAVTGDNEKVEKQADLHKRVTTALKDQSISQTDHILLLKAVESRNDRILESIMKRIEGEKGAHEVRVAQSKAWAERLKKEQEKEEEIRQKRIKEIKDTTEKEYDIRRELRELNLKQILIDIEEQIAAEEDGSEKKKALELALVDYKQALRLDDAARVAEVQDSITSSIESNLTDMLLAEKSFGDGVNDIWKGIGRTISEMLIKTVIEEKAAAIIRIAAEQAVASAKAISAYAGIPFIGIALGIAAVAAITSEINKNKTFQGGGTVPGAEGVPVQATVHGGEEIVTPQQQRRGAGRGVSIGTILIQFPNVTSFSDWMNASPAVVKQVTERKILQALSTLEDEGKVKEGTVLI